MTWKESIRQDLLERDMSQGELARMIGAGKQEVSRWLNTNQKTTASNVLRMARVLGWTQKKFLENICPGALELPEDDDE